MITYISIDLPINLSIHLSFYIDNNNNCNAPDYDFILLYFKAQI